MSCKHHLWKASLHWLLHCCMNKVSSTCVYVFVGVCVCVFIFVQNSNSSRWYGYLKSLPAYTSIPLFWEEEAPEALALLKGTDLMASLPADCALVKRAFNKSFLPLRKKHPLLFPPPYNSFTAFLRAFSLVTSRAFHVVDYHGASFVPLADAYVCLIGVFVCFCC